MHTAWVGGDLTIPSGGAALVRPLQVVVDSESSVGLVERRIGAVGAVAVITELSARKALTVSVHHHTCICIVSYEKDFFVKKLKEIEKQCRI